MIDRNKKPNAKWSAVTKASALCLPLLFSACALGPDYERPEYQFNDYWYGDYGQESLDQDSLSRVRWWDLFDDPQLEEFIRQALDNNHDLRLAVLRIEEARSSATVAGSGLWPSLGIGVDASREKESALTNSEPTIENTFFFGPQLSWELDLWGANRRTKNAANAEFWASEYAAQAVRLSLISEVASTYFALQSADARLAISHETLKIREKGLDIAEKRFKGGLTSKLEVKQTEVELESTRALIPSIEQLRHELENRLSLLMGKQGERITLQTTLFDHALERKVGAGLPASLIERRPDIIEAENLLRASSERIGVAQAAFLPNISLTGSFGVESEEFQDLLSTNGQAWVIELNALAPLFNAGRISAQYKASKTRYQQDLVRYEQTVLKALHEVSDLINAFYKNQTALDAQATLVSASNEYLELAIKRYRNGVLAYIDVLDAQRRLFDAQLSESQVREKQLQITVDLYKALGGGWEQERQALSSTR